MDISMLRDRPKSDAMTVSELNGFIKNLFDTNRLLSSVSVRGEISNFKLHSSGHLYFSLKDGDGQIRAVMFRGNALRLKFAPENGMKVTVHGSVSVYTRDGSYQLYVSTIEPDGIGALYMAYEQLRAKLEAEGLFDPRHKKVIPKFPSSIGVVTSPTGAAVRDIINVIKRRYPLATIYLYPALVQGEGAEASLIKALDYLDRSNLVDTVIIGRGGGSIEDLWAFNSERLARRIFECNVPVISAVGHETDFTICDFVADLRAPTPSAAAELAVPDTRELLLWLSGFKDRCDRALIRLVEERRDRLSSLTSRRIFTEPKALVDVHRGALQLTVKDIENYYLTNLRRLRADFAENTARIEALSPLAVLGRGYSVATKSGLAIKNIKNLCVGDEVDVRVSDGSFTAEVTKIRE